MEKLIDASVSDDGGELENTPEGMPEPAVAA
jgi:hypothetical protein